MAILQVISLLGSVPIGSALSAQPYTAYSGNDVLLEILTTKGDQPLPLAGCTVQYHLRQVNSGSELSGFPKSATLDPDPDGTGKCTVSLPASVTAGLNGSFNHSLVVTDPSATPSTVTTVMVGSATFQTGGI